MSKKILIGLFAFFSFFQSIIASEISEHIFREILENSEYCTHSYDEEKIVLKSENLYFTQEGLFLDLNGFDHIALPYILSGRNGPYIIPGTGMFNVFNTCPHCGETYFVRCKNPDCDSNKK